MIVLVSGSTRSMARLGPQSNLGVLFTPKGWTYYQQPTAGLPWAADNSAFTRTGFDAPAFEAMLDRLYVRGLPHCLFVTTPDVVANAAATLRLFWHWRPRIRPYGWPLAFVAQDGITLAAIPWRSFDVLFLGGSTAFKLGADAYTLCAYAKALGKRVHVGRVNSPRRLALFDVADSIDGTATSRYGDIKIPIMLAAARRPPRARVLQRELRYA